MAVIGVELDQDSLVLTRGRDFKWLFDNLDEHQQPTAFPAGDLYFELLTGGEHNALQEVRMTAASGGSYKLGLDGNQTTAIDFDEVVLSSHHATSDITGALEALPNVGAGNVLVHPAKLYPVWEITLTLNAGNNEKQQITFSSGATGTYKLGYNGVYTAVLTVGGPAATVQTALEGLAGIGSGNVSVTPIPNGYEVEFVGSTANTNMQQILASAFGMDLSQPTWFYGLNNFATMKVATLIEGTSKFTNSMVNTLNTSVNAFFNSFEALLGVDIDYKVVDNLNTKLTVTSLAAFAESDLLTFAADVTGTSIEGWLNSVSTLFGIFDTIHVDFYWNRVYQVEFIRDLAETPMPALVPDTTDLTGLNSTQDIEVTVLAPGKNRLTKWPFAISGATASLTVESETADQIGPRTKWQLVFLPDGEAAGGDPVALGRVVVQD